MKHAFITLSLSKSEDFPKDYEALNLLYEVATIINYTPIEGVSHPFSPTGASAILLLKESHMSFHSWPENLEIYLDIFSCRDDESELNKAYEILYDKLKAVGGVLTIYER